MDDYPRVRRRALWAARECAVHIAISRALRDSIAQYTGDASKLRVIPDGVDGDVFRPAQNGVRPIPNQILFAGTIRPVKGVDVLLAGMKAPNNWGPEYVKGFDAIYPELTAKYGVALYPFFLDGVALDPTLVQADGLHPTAAGVAVIVKRMLPDVEVLLEHIAQTKTAVK